MFSIPCLVTCQSKLLMTYKHLKQVERYQIHALMKAGLNQSEICKLIDRHKSTITRELIRNTGSRGCHPKQALRYLPIERKTTATPIRYLLGLESAIPAAAQLLVTYLKIFENHLHIWYNLNLLTTQNPCADFGWLAK